MYVRFKGNVYYQRYIDSDYGGNASAKSALIAYRDDLLKGINYQTTVRKKKLGKNSELLTGVIEVTERIKNNGNEMLVEAIVATHPTVRHKKKRFNYVKEPTRKNQRTRNDAVHLANLARLEWERELGFIQPPLDQLFE